MTSSLPFETEGARAGARARAGVRASQQEHEQKPAQEQEPQQEEEQDHLNVTVEINIPLVYNRTAFRVLLWQGGGTRLIFGVRN